MSNQKAVSEAQHMARLYRRAGFPEAHAAPQYCIDELGEDGFYTYTVSVYVGEKTPRPHHPFTRNWPLNSACPFNPPEESHMNNPFFGMSRKTFTHAELKFMAEEVASALGKIEPQSN